MLGLGRITIPSGVPGAGQALGESWGSCSGELSRVQAVWLSSTSGLPAVSLNADKTPVRVGPPQMVRLLKKTPVCSPIRCSMYLAAG